MRADLSQLIASGRIGDARKVLSGLASHSNHEKLARCLVEAASGNEVVAFDLAADLASRALPPDLLVEALVLAGRFDYAKGRWVDGANRFTRAKQVAKDAQNKTLVARATASHTEALLHFFTLDSAVSHVRELRQTAVSAGTAEGLFEYRIILAEMESRLGRSKRAARELELADVFLQAAPSFLREARWHLARCNVSAGIGDWKDAFDAATSAYRVATTAGASVVAEISLNNLAYAQVAVGRLAEARDSIHKLAASQRGSRQVPPD